jgi:hypothetical protein
MRRWAFFLTIVLALTTELLAQDIPEQLRGKWRVRKIIPTRTICCFGEREARSLLGTEIEYTANSFRWKDQTTLHPGVTFDTLSAAQFHSDNSGGGSTDSQVTFRELGVHADEIMQVSLDHPAAKITAGSVEIPGDRVLLKSRNVILFSMCNVYYEAVRKHVVEKH